MQLVSILFYIMFFMFLSKYKIMLFNVFFYSKTNVFTTMLLLITRSPEVILKEAVSPIDYIVPPHCPPPKKTCQTVLQGNVVLGILHAL